ncbi:MAG: hypothetical protein QW364_03515 [Thermoplasmatales archaeon]
MPCPKTGSVRNRDMGGHISKRDSSILRFILVNAAHTVIMHSGKMRKNMKHSEKS